MASTATQNPTYFRPWLWAAAWIALGILHVTWMSVDWHLRDPPEPMFGGLPETATVIFQWGSLGLFGIAVYLFMPRRWAVWIRATLALLQTIAAFVLMVFGWLHYVIGNGIDTL